MLEELWDSYKFNGDDNAKDEIIKECLPMIRVIASRLSIYASSSHDIDDLVSAGIIGLLDAIEKFDPSKGAGFKTYATYRIKGAILDEVRALDWVPRSVREKAQKLDKAYFELEQQLERTPTEIEIAQYLEMSVEELRKILLETRSMVLIRLDDITLDEESEGAIIDFVTNENSSNPEGRTAFEQARNLLAQAIRALPEQEKLVLSLYYYEEMTMKEIGTILNVSESRVSQIHSSAVLRLRSKLKRLKTDLLSSVGRQAYA